MLHLIRVQLAEMGKISARLEFRLYAGLHPKTEGV